MDEPDLTGMRTLTRAEIRERRARQGGRKKATPKVHHKTTRRKRERRGPHKTEVHSVSIPPELYIRARRDLGGGSFSKAVNYAIKKALIQLEEKHERRTTLRKP